MKFLFLRFKNSNCSSNKYQFDYVNVDSLFMYIKKITLHFFIYLCTYILTLTVTR